MEKKKIRCSYHFKDKLVEYHTLFGYQLEKEENSLFSQKKLVFIREGVSEETKMVEGKYHLYPFLNYIPVVIACVLALILASLFLAFSFIDRDNRFTYFLSFMIPTFVLLPLIAIYSYIRYYFDNKNINILMTTDAIKKELEGK